MKSELRHKLQRNALADWLVETGQTLKPYQNHLTILAIGVLALLVAYSVLSHASATRAAQAWEQVDAGLYGKPEALAKVAEENRNSPAGQMAAVLAADTYLYEGCELEFRNKAEARDALKKAIQLYESPELSSGPSMLQERALFGLARAKECKGDADDLADAVQKYEEVVKKWPHGAYTAAAKQRIGDLKNRETRQMYDDLAKFTPPGAVEPGGTLTKPPALDLPSERPKSLDEPKKTAPASK